MSSPSAERRPEAPPRDFIREIIAQDLVSGTHGSGIVTRFPPEPNGRLHIGHAKAICIDFGVAQEFGGRCNLRFDDTNPVKESQEYVDEIERDIRWLGFDWGEHLYHASDYFEQLYQWAEQLVREGKAYVDSLTADEMREYRGTLTEPGRDSPYRDRSVDENLDLFRRMRAGEFDDGAHVLRAKIDMASGNINMRDPVMYRIRKTPHQRTGDTWCHLSDVRLGARPVGLHRGGHPFALHARVRRPSAALRLVSRGARASSAAPAPDRVRAPEPELHGDEQAAVARTGRGWTRRRLGRSAHADDFRIAEARLHARVDPELLRAHRRGEAQAASSTSRTSSTRFAKTSTMRAPRVMAVLNPLKVVIENYPEGQSDEVDVINNPEDPSAGTRKVPFGRELYIERDDFMEDPPKKFFRLSPGNEVRLRCAYFIRCTGVVKDPVTGEVVELRATYDPATRGGDSPDGRKVKATLHWVSASARARRRSATLRSPLHRTKIRPTTENFLDHLNPKSLDVISAAKVEPTSRTRRPVLTLSVRAPRLFLRRRRLHGRARSSSTARCRFATPGPGSRRSSSSS